MKNTLGGVRPIIATGVLFLLFFVFNAKPVLAAKQSPVKFSAGDLAGDFVKDIESNKIWFINPIDSRRYQITPDDQGLFQRLQSLASAQALVKINQIPEAGSTTKTIAVKNRLSLMGLVYDSNNPGVLWHIQRRSYRRQSLKSSQDILDYAQKAMSVKPEQLAEYPIEYSLDPILEVKDSGKGVNPPNQGKFIEVNLAEQRLRAYQDGRLINTFLISSGVSRHPTPKMQTSVLQKDPYVNYVWSYGKDNKDNYDLGLVPYNLMIATHKYIHYAYWHHNFGHPMSHGCINVALNNIKWIYRWADKGTAVAVE